MSRTIIQDKVSTFEDLINFGKYKGQTVEDVIDKDPQYIEWALEEEILKLKPRVISYLQDKLEDTEQGWYGLDMWDVCNLAD